MTTREQDNALERLSYAEAGAPIAVRDGYEDRHVEVTVDTGRCTHLNEDGLPVKTEHDFSIRWGINDTP